MRNLMQGGHILECLIRGGNKFRIASDTLGGSYTIDDGAPHVLFLDPGGASRNVLLPAEAAGQFFFIVNTADAAETLTVLEDGGSTTIGTLEQGQSALFVCSATVWYQVADQVESSYVEVADAASYTVLATNSGKTHVVADQGQDCTIALPTPQAGLEFTFVYGGVAADANDFLLDTGSNTNFFLGGLLYADDAPAADSVAGNGSSNSIVSINTPEPGTRVHVVCDGTNWILSGVVASANAPTFANQA